MYTVTGMKRVNNNANYQLTLIKLELIKQEDTCDNVSDKTVEAEKQQLRIFPLRVFYLFKNL